MTVLKQSFAHILRQLLVSHILYPNRKLLVDDPEVVAEQLVSFFSIVKAHKHLLKIVQEVLLELAHRLLRLEDLECNSIQGEGSKLDLVDREKLAHQTLLRAQELLVIDDKHPFVQDFAVEGHNVLITLDLLPFVQADQGEVVYEA